METEDSVVKKWRNTGLLIGLTENVEEIVANAFEIAEKLITVDKIIESGTKTDAVTFVVIRKIIQTYILVITNTEKLNNFVMDLIVDLNAKVEILNRLDPEVGQLCFEMGVDIWAEYFKAYCEKFDIEKYFN